MRPRLAMQRAEVELGLGAGGDADDDDAAVRAQRLDVRAEVRRADELEDDVERAVLLEALGLEHVVGAELRDGVAGVGVAHRRGDVRADRMGELDGGRADAAGGAVHEQPLAGAQPGLGEDRVVGGREDLGQPAGVGERRPPRARA